MRPLHFFTVLLLSMSACEQPAPQPPERGTSSSSQPRAPMPAPPAVLPSHLPPRVEPERSFLGPLEIRETVEIPAEPVPEPERDLAAELRAAFGSPTGCGPLSTEPSFTLQLEVFVTTSGRVSRAHITGAVPDETLACLQTRLESLRFQSPVPDAPRPVRTELTVLGTGGQPARRVLIPRVGPPGFPNP